MIRSPQEIYGRINADHEVVPLEDEYCSLNFSEGPSRQPEYVPASLLSSMLSTGGPPGRQYIDPWDLENYAYLQQR